MICPCGRREQGATKRRGRTRLVAGRLDLGREGLRAPDTGLIATVKRRDYSPIPYFELIIDFKILREFPQSSPRTCANGDLLYNCSKITNQNIDSETILVSRVQTLFSAQLCVFIYSMQFDQKQQVFAAPTTIKIQRLFLLQRDSLLPLIYICMTSHHLPSPALPPGHEKSVSASIFLSF